MKDLVNPKARKPRIAIMGEFSAGKSTLTNLLLGARPLPEKVTATRLSPVWISQGSDAPYRVDIDGSEEPVSLERLEDISVDDTRVIRLFFDADLLTLCDIIDFPGISDPNMDPVVWQRVLDEVDIVLWCTHATQAWRQSEAAVWETVPEAVRARSLLLVTRFDKLTNPRDRNRVKMRLQKETERLFAGVFPISLTQALAAGEDYEKWEASGGAAFSEKLIAVIQQTDATTEAAQTDAAQDVAPADNLVPLRSADTAGSPEQGDVDAETDRVAPSRQRVLPRRVVPGGSSSRSRIRRPLRDPSAAQQSNSTYG